MNIQYLLSKLIKKLHIPAIKNSNIDKTSKVCSASHIVNVKIARYSYIGNFCTVINTEIGNFCSIADNNIIGGSSHPIEWVSTSPVFHSGKNIMDKNFSRHYFETTKRTRIGNDVWVGNNCLIKSGISIGDGAIIGMGSVITKDVEPYAIVAGNPGKILRKRFDDKTIEMIINTRWWEWDDDVLAQKACFFNNIDGFINSDKKI